MMADRVGEQLGNYRLTYLLSDEGGFADVYLGEHIHLGTQAAIKVLTRKLTDKEIAQFRDEARTMINLQHPNIVQVLDFGMEGRLPFIVMQYAPNGSLGRLHPRGTCLPLQTILTYVKQVASALQYAHDRRVIHRDVKPENMLIGKSNELLLSDFGIAIIAHRTDSWVQQNISGTEDYMAPEQLYAKAVPASDQYALGIAVYRWLCGELPFTEGYIGYHHNHTPPPSLHTHVPSILPAVERVVLQALAKDPQQRFPSVQAFADALQRASQSSPDADPLLSESVIPTKRISPPSPPPKSEDLRKVLAISPVEAQTGTTRTLTLASGRKVRVTVPAGVADGHVLRLEGQGEAAAVGGQAGALILTISVTHEQAPLLIAGALATEHTARSVNTPVPATQAPTVGTTRSQAAQSPGTVAPLHQSFVADSSLDKLHPPQRGISRRIVVIGLLGVAAVGVGGLTWLGLSRSSSPTATPSSILIPTAATSSILTPTGSPLGTTFYIYRGPSFNLRVLAWSPDGKRIALGSDNYTAQVWDAATGNNAIIYHGHSSYVEGVAWSPDSKRVASGSADGTVQIWDATDGNLIYTYQGHGMWVNRVSWSPNGKYIVSGDQSSVSGQPVTVRVWEASTGHTRVIYRGHTNGVFAVTWSPDGTRVASCGYDGTLQVWEGTTGNLIAAYRSNITLFGLSWSHDSKYIAAGGNATMVWVLDANTGSIVSTYDVHSEQVPDVAWSPDGLRIAAGSHNQAVYVLNAATGKNLYTYTNTSQSSHIDAIVWSPDSKRIASGGNNGTVQVWQAT